MTTLNTIIEDEFANKLSSSIRYSAGRGQYDAFPDCQDAYLDGVETAIAMMYIDLTGSPKSEGILSKFLHHQLQKAREDWLRSEIEKLDGSENTFFNDWNEEKEKLDDGTSKEDAVTFIEKIIPLAKTCPFCGKVPVFTYSVGKRDTSGYIGHFTKREGCCDATGIGKTELFFCNKDQSENYGLWAKQMFWQIQKWNERTNNKALTSIITRYKEELLELEKGV